MTNHHPETPAAAPAVLAERWSKELRPCALCGRVALLAPCYSHGETLFTAYCASDSWCLALTRGSPADAVASWNLWHARRIRRGWVNELLAWWRRRRQRRNLQVYGRNTL